MATHKTFATGAVVLSFAVLFACAASPAFGQSGAPGMKEGKDLFLQGKFEDALLKFEEVMRSNPSSEEALRLRDMAGVEFLIQMMMKGGKYRDIAEYILSRSEEMDDTRKSNPELIEEIVKDLMSDDMRRYSWALERLAFEVGEYAVPLLAKMLGDEQDARSRERAVIALSRMGSQVTLPVIECLNSQSSVLRQGAIIVLGHLRDLRAVADLKKVFEDPKEAPEVKNIARAALKAITGEDAEKLRPAREYYYNRAMMYYLNHPAVIKNYDRTWLFWKWNDESGEIEMEVVPRWLYNFKIAEETCFDALAIDYTYISIWPILALVNLAEYNEAVVHLQGAPEAVKDKIQEIADRNFSGWVGGLMASQEALFDALEIALRHNDATVAVSVINALAECANHQYIPQASAQPPAGAAAAPVAGPPGESTAGRARPQHPLLAPTGVPGDKLVVRGGWPLIEALAYPDKRVRYAAAVALVKIHNRSEVLKKNQFAGSKRVIEVLVEALGESGARSILVGTTDVQTRNDLVGELIKMDYFAMGADSPANAISRALRFPSEDLIILDMDVAMQLVFQASVEDVERKITVLDAIRQDYRTREVPVIILCDESRLERAKELFSEDAKGFITKPLNFAEVKLQLGEIFAQFPLDDKARATQIAADAAKAAASIDPIANSFPLQANKDREWGELMAALTAVIEKRADEVRAPALMAMARFATPDYIPPVTRVIRNSEANLPEIRAVAARALGDIMLRAKNIPEETFEALLLGIGHDESSPAVRAACGEALGKAPIKPEERFKALSQGRIRRAGSSSE